MLLVGLLLVPGAVVCASQSNPVTSDIRAVNSVVPISSGRAANYTSICQYAPTWSRIQGEIKKCPSGTTGRCP